MTKRAGFTVSKTSDSRGGKDVFKTVLSSGRTVNVMSADSYARAIKRANKSLAASELSQLQHRKP